MDIKKIMYVEDNPIKYMGVTRFLKNIGVENIKQAKDSSEALALVGQEAFDYDGYAF